MSSGELTRLTPFFFLFPVPLFFPPFFLWKEGREKRHFHKRTIVDKREKGKEGKGGGVLPVVQRGTFPVPLSLLKELAEGKAAIRST